MTFIPFLQGATPGGSGTLMTILPFALIFVIFYFFMIRPQNRKQKETEKMLSALKKGDKIITVGGIHGVVSSTKEKTVIVKVDDDAKIEFTRSAIASVVVDKPAGAPAVEERPSLFGSLFGGKKAAPAAPAAPAETPKDAAPAEGGAETGKKPEEN